MNMRDLRHQAALRRCRGIGAALLSILTLAACSEADKAEFREKFKLAVHGDRDIPPGHQNRLQWQNIGQPVHFAPGSATLTREQAQSLDLFMRRVEAKPGESVRLVAGQPDQAGGRALADRRIAVLRAYLAGRRVSVGQIALVPGSDDANSVTVSVDRNVAVVANCPSWQSVMVNGQFEADRKQFGCVVMQSLGTHVDNVNDLVRGRELGKGDGTVLAKGVLDYRATPAAPSTTSTTSSTSSATTK